MIALKVRDNARLRAQRHMDAAMMLVDELGDPELKDALRRRIRELWNEASIAMSLVDELERGSA